MSWLSTAIGDVEKFFEGNQVAQTALADLETAGLNLVEVSINAVLAKVPGGVLGSAIADAYLNDVISGLNAKVASHPAVQTVG